MSFETLSHKEWTVDRGEELFLLFRFPLASCKRNAFTLVELLIVIIIIGVLSSSLLLVAGEVEEKSTATRIISDARTMKAAALLYHSEHNSWPVWALAGQTYRNMVTGLENEVPSKYVGRLPVNDRYWLGVMNDSSLTSGDVTAAVVLYDTGLSAGVRQRMSQVAEEMGIYAIGNIMVMDFSSAYTYTDSDNNMIWFLTDGP